MTVTHEHEGNVYLFSNEDLKGGDPVFPISNGRSDYETGTYIHREFDFSDCMCGFPNAPHTLIDLEYSINDKAYEVRTSHGYGPKEKYFKIISITPKS